MQRRYYLIWSNEHRAWWGPDSLGYTTVLEKAGRYTKAEADHICGSFKLPGSGYAYEVAVIAPEAMQHITTALTFYRNQWDEVGEKAPDTPESPGEISITIEPHDLLLEDAGKHASNTLIEFGWDE
jgi:hypothetical protein